MTTWLDGIFSRGGGAVAGKVAAFAEARNAVLADNIANIDTAGYKTKDLSVAEFQQTLAAAIDESRQTSGPLELKATRHIQVDSSGAVSYEPVETLRMVLEDSLAGVDSASIRWQVQGRTFRVGDPGLILHGDTLILLATPGGLAFQEGDTVRSILLAAADRAVGCGPNAIAAPETTQFRMLDQDTLGPSFGNFAPDHVVADPLSRFLPDLGPLGGLR